MTSPATRPERWPAERFYWAVLEAPGYARSGPLAPGLRASLEDELPVAIDSLHAVGTPLDDQRLVVCAAPWEALQALEPGTLSLTPESLPDFAAGGTPESLNLLTGEFEPIPIRRGRARRNLLAMAACLACSALLSFGLLRRAHAWTNAAAQAHIATELVLKNVAVPSPEALTLELRRLGGTPHTIKSDTPAADAALTLASLLNTWPAQVPSKPQSLAINASGLSVAVTVEGDPSPFLKAFKAPQGFTQDEPQINTAGTVTRVNLRLRPKGATP